MGGKTGTTNDNADGWFMAFTPELVSGTWVGGEDRYIHFNNMAQGQGASMALPVYGKYITKVYADSTLPYSQQSPLNSIMLYYPAGYLFMFTSCSSISSVTVMILVFA